MERNVSYSAIGFLFIATMFFILAFIFWGDKINSDSGYKTYYLYSQKEIGVREDSPIRYQGINIGRVKKIGFKKDNIGTVQVDMLIDKNIPIRKDAYIVADSQGLAGINFLSLKQQNSGDVIGESDEPVIRLGQNTFDKIIDRVDSASGDAQAILNNLGSIFSTQNAETISKILDSLNSGLYGLESTKGEIDVLMKNLNKKLDNGEFDIKAIMMPTLIELESNLQEMNRVLNKGSIFLDRLEENPYNTIFGSSEGKKENKKEGKK